MSFEQTLGARLFPEVNRINSIQNGSLKVLISFPAIKRKFLFLFGIFNVFKKFFLFSEFQYFLEFPKSFDEKVNCLCFNYCSKRGQIESQIYVCQLRAIYDMTLNKKCRNAFLKMSFLSSKEMTQK